MPRKESNAPTERIIRILDDIAGLEAYCDDMERLIIEKYPDDLPSFPVRPTMEHVISERTRQGITLEQTRTRRKYAQRVAQLAKDHGIENVISFKDLEDKL